MKASFKTLKHYLQKSMRDKFVCSYARIMDSILIPEKIQIYHCPLIGQLKKSNSSNIEYF